MSEKSSKPPPPTDALLATRTMELPLVSAIVISAGTPQVNVALASVVRQSYPSIEMIVVDATGGNHAPVPSFEMHTPRIVRTLGGDRRLHRAEAANIGLLNACGEWLCFLDDKGAYDGDFISAMIKASEHHPESLLVYGCTRILRADGQVVGVFGRPFNRLLMHSGPILFWQSALIRRAVVELGCRFDEALEIGDDRDFLAQIAEHSDFAFVPVTGFNYRSEEMSSGAAGANRDIAKVTRFESLVRAKSSGAFAYHARRTSRFQMRAARAFGEGDREQSRELFETLLREYPDDPNGLHGLALIRLDQGLLEDAKILVERALAIKPSAGEYRLTRAAILARLGRRQDARRDGVLAARTPALRPAAEKLLRELGPADSMDAADTASAQAKSPATSRFDLCACGSGKRHEQCCGRTVAVSAPLKTDRVVQKAAALFLRGEAYRAKALIDTLVPADIANPELSRTAGEICIDSECFEQAYGYLERSAKLAPSARTEGLLTACCDLIWADQARASAHAMVLRLRERIEKRVTAHRSSNPGPIHLLGTFGTIGGSETRAASLYRTLSGHSDVRLWSTGPPLEGQYPGLPIRVLEPARGAFPNGGTLVLAGHYFHSGDWWREAAFDRVVICVNLDLPTSLVHRLTDIEEITQVGRIDFTFPSRLCRDIFGLPGHIEYSFADVPRFTRTAARHTEGNRLIIGRHSRDVRLKHHPNDPALYRQLVARGHRVRVLGGTCLQAAFSGDPAASAVELIPTGSEDPRDFLSGLDCFVFRKHPHFLETGGAAILEAMAMALPTVIFRDGVGAAEIIEHGRDGFLVDTEEEALACLDRLAAEPDLRAAIGSAARRKVIATMEEQRRRILAYYLGSAQSEPVR